MFSPRSLITQTQFQTWIIYPILTSENSIVGSSLDAGSDSNLLRRICFIVLISRLLRRPCIRERRGYSKYSCVRCAREQVHGLRSYVTKGPSWPVKTLIKGFRCRAAAMLAVQVADRAFPHFRRKRFASEAEMDGVLYDLKQIARVADVQERERERGRGGEGRREKEGEGGRREGGRD